MCLLKVPLMLLTVMAFVVLFIPPTDSMVLLDGKSDNDDAVVDSVKENILVKHKDLVDWFKRAAERLKENKTASKEDLDEIRGVLFNSREQVYKFVTSPLFNLTTSLFIEEALLKVAPFLGVLPLQELREFFSIVNKDPSLSKLVFEGDDDAVGKIFPEAIVLEDWVNNNTARVVEEFLQPPKEDQDEYDYFADSPKSEAAM